MQHHQTPVDNPAINPSTHNFKRKPKPSKSKSIRQALDIIDKFSDDITLYCDGSALDNPGPCGSGAYSNDLLEGQNIEVATSLGFGSNNIGELTALAQACSLIIEHSCQNPDDKRKFLILSDSNYAIGIATSSYKIRENKKLCHRLVCLYRLACKTAKVYLHHVPAHVQIHGNEEADRLAKLGANGNGSHTIPVSEYLDHYLPIPGGPNQYV